MRRRISIELEMPSGLASLIMPARIENNRLIELPRHGPLVDVLPVSMLEEQLFSASDDLRRLSSMLGNGRASAAQIRIARSRQEHWIQAIRHQREIEAAERDERARVGYPVIVQPASEPSEPGVHTATLASCAATLGALPGWFVFRARASCTVNQ